MLSFSNTNTSGSSATVGIGGLYVNGSNPYGMCIWSPTARSLVTGGATNLSVDDADRTSTKCFMRGLKENVRIQTSTPLPWLWRRIVFTTKCNAFQVNITADANPAQTYRPYSDTSVGMARLWFNLQQNNQPATVNFYNGIIFRGTVNQDWVDTMTAKVDTSRITVLSDKTQTIRTGNSNGHFSERKLWYGFNKTLVYDDDEAGSQEVTSYFSTEAKPGMGDVYVVDYFQPGVGSGSGDIISVNATSTLYWHEK